MSLQKDHAIRSRRLLDTSRGQPCTLRLPGCDGGGDTTVAAHSNRHFHGKAGGLKSDDIFSCDACANCHDIYDGRKRLPVGEECYPDEAFDRALTETFRRRFRDGSLRIG
jgi:hypothetical protein